MFKLPGAVQVRLAPPELTVRFPNDAPEVSRHFLRHLLLLMFTVDIGFVSARVMLLTATDPHIFSTRGKNQHISPISRLVV